MPALPEINFKRTPVSLIIVAVAVALEVVCTLDPVRRDFYYMDMRLGMLSPIWSGEIWRPFTSSLLHANPFHAAFNCYWMIVFGSMLESRYGSWRFLGLIVLLAYVSAMPQFVITNFNRPIDQQVGCVGLSGIGYGLFGLLWVGRRYRPEFHAVCDNATVQLFVAWFFLCILLTQAGIMPVANIAHGAGALFGALYGKAAFARKHRGRWMALAAVATTLVLATLIACPGHNGYEHARELRKYREIQRLIEEVGQPAGEDGQ